MAATENDWLIDTAILVDLLRGFRPARDWIDSLPSPTRTISFVTVAELIAGARNQNEQRAIERELTLYLVLWIDEQIARLALDLYRRHHLRHHTGFLDCLVAATAMSQGLRLATLNLGHFAPITGLHAEKPY